MKRELSEVIDEMTKVIPKDRSSLICQLNDIRSSAMFSPPEGMHTWWAELQTALIDEIGEPTEPWQFEVAAIFNPDYSRKIVTH
jgi:hypothetical protein